MTQSAQIQNRSRALAHPLRSGILTILAERAASPSEMLVDLPGAKLEDVTYHTRYLLKLGLAEVVEEKRVRGWKKTIYRATTELSSPERADVALDAIAKRLETAEGSPYAELEAVADILASTGRRVAVAGTA